MQSYNFFMTSKYIYSIFTFAYTSYPGRDNFSNISLQNLANRLYQEKRVGSAAFQLKGHPIKGQTFYLQ